jgi:hypothetical protein
MVSLPEAVYMPTDDPDTYESTELANAGWYDEGQHGGALAALIAGHLDSVDSLTPMQTTRFTMEIFRVVRIIPLRLETEVVRQGKRIQVLECRVHGEGEEVTRAHVQRLRLDEIGLPSDVTEAAPAMPPPDLVPPSGLDWGPGPDQKVMFHRHAIDAREVVGGFRAAGPGAAWFRLTKPVIAGREVMPLQRLLAAADVCNGISRPTAERDWVFMNPDLSVNVNRVPRGEWVGLDAVSSYSPLGRGQASGTLWDTTGFLGRSTQTLYLDRV